MNYLIVVAHPDDEVLGAGATIYKLAKQNEKINLCILSGKAAARQFRPETEELISDLKQSSNILGVNQTIIGDFPNIKFNTVPHLEMVQFIEKAIIETEADVIITHHPNDLNNDHHHTSIACQAAMRIFQRKEQIKPIKDFLFMEVPSSSEWAINTSLEAFHPNTFIEIDKGGLDKKLEALKEYRGVMRPFPHPRSLEGITGLAAYRGSQSGCMYAEAFESVFRRLS